MAVDSQTPDTVATNQAPSGQESPAGTQEIQQAANETAGTTSPVDQALPEPQFAPRPYDGQQSLQGDDDLVFGPTQRPMEHLGFGAMRGAPTVPPKAATWLSSLNVAAKDPDAPPKVVELQRLVNAIMSGQVR